MTTVVPSKIALHYVPTTCVYPVAGTGKRLARAWIEVTSSALTDTMDASVIPGMKTIEGIGMNTVAGVSATVSPTWVRTTVTLAQGTVGACVFELIVSY